MKKRVCSKCGTNRIESQFAPRARVCNPCKKKSTRRTARNSHLLKTYGITIEEYEEWLRAQDGCCAICRDRRPYNLAVDHDHALEPLIGIKESIRGLLCKRCNKLLRDVRDRSDILRLAAFYVDHRPKHKVMPLPQVWTFEADEHA